MSEIGERPSTEKRIPPSAPESESNRRALLRYQKALIQSAQKAANVAGEKTTEEAYAKKLTELGQAA